MNIISREEFIELSGKSGKYQVSIYIPTHRSGAEVNEKQDMIVFKNALQSVKRRLKAEDALTSDKIDDLLKPGFDLLDDQGFWNNQTEGLAVFLADKYCRTLQLPYAVQQQVLVNHVFQTGPLVPALTTNDEFYLLVLSKHDAKFFKGNAFSLERVEVEGLPNGMDDVVHFEEKQDLQLFRQGGKGGAGGANFHGHGEGQLEDKANIALYFKEVDRTLFAEVLHDKHIPLLLCAVDYLISIYKANSKYQYIADDAIIGNYEYEGNNALFIKAKEKLQPYFKQRTQNALQNYYNQIATSLTSSIPEHVIPASYYAKVSDLFICKDEHLWGRFNETDNVLQMHAQKQDDDEDLLNQAAVKTYLNGGSVNILERDKMPGQSTIAAFFRY